ncbi:hypothetical protein Tco_0298689 [Tanacetum coccineum]
MPSWYLSTSDEYYTSNDDSTSFADKSSDDQFPLFKLPSKYVRGSLLSTQPGLAAIHTWSCTSNKTFGIRKPKDGVGAIIDDGSKGKRKSETGERVADQWYIMKVDGVSIEFAVVVFSQNALYVGKKSIILIVMDVWAWFMVLW